MKTTYIPQPISTEDVELSKDILELSEKIAENVYKTYYEDGWVVVNYNDYDYNDGIYEIGAMDYVVGG